MSNVIYLSANGRELRAEIRARINSGQITQADVDRAITAIRSETAPASLPPKLIWIREQRIETA
ncbi:MAG: hypothetical protein U5N10_17505 [Gemmobacter sp.]|nr:hypothetical protein [Gemmobacter sp.]